MDEQQLEKQRIRAERNKRKQQRKRGRKLGNQQAHKLELAASKHAEEEPSSAASNVPSVNGVPLPEHLFRVPDEVLAQYKSEAAYENKGKKRKSNNTHNSNKLSKTTAQSNKSKKKKTGPDGHRIVDKVIKQIRSATKGDQGQPTDLEAAGEQLFAWLIHPITVEDFFDDYYQQKPLLVKRKDPQYYEGWMSKTDIENLLEEKKLRYNIDFDVTSYKDGKRSTLNESESSIPKANKIWKQYHDDGCSIRLKRPQQFKDAMWRLIACIESFWKCGGGANAYLTPAGFQGFAPHYDDIEAFCMQLEGKKCWKVYSFYDGNDAQVAGWFPKHPRYSSEDFEQSQLKHLKPAFDSAEVVLEPGDLLYLPRGIVHQANSPSDKHSLHLTLSMGQKNTWADFLMRALPKAVEAACHESNNSDYAIALRSSLPLDYAEFMGVVNAEDGEGSNEEVGEDSDQGEEDGMEDEQAQNGSDTRRKEFVKNIVELVTKAVMKELPYDVVADEMTCGFLHDRHAPEVDQLPEGINSWSEVGHGPDAEDEDDEQEDIGDLNQIRLKIKDCARITVTPETAVLYHSMKNSRVYREVDPRGIEFELDDAPVLEQIVRSTGWIAVGALACESAEDRQRIVDVLLRENVIELR